MNENVILVKLVLDNDRGTGIQAPSLRMQGTIKNWIPVSTGNPGFLLAQE
jgi:hypothetical protein